MSEKKVIKFAKLEGCGNDYVYIDGSKNIVENKPEVVRKLSDRHFGIGGDGVIFINPSPIADFEMEMFNADGTRAEMCGNGIRCVAKFVYDFGLTDQTDITVESMGKIKYLHLTLEDGKVSMVRVDMGEPELIAKNIPVIAESEKVIDAPIVVQDQEYRMTCVSMGNPHAVVFMEPKNAAGIDAMNLEAIGPDFENNKLFPARINTEFVSVLDKNTVRMRVWERGTGETLACGTGCCATAVACVLNGYTDRNITVRVSGGEIKIEWNEEDNHIYMTGPATLVFTGEVEIK